MVILMESNAMTGMKMTAMDAPLFARLSSITITFVEICQVFAIFVETD